MKLFIAVEHYTDAFGGIFKTFEEANEIAEEIGGYVEMYDTETEACFPVEDFQEVVDFF